LANEYPADVRRSARRLWLTGRYSDEEVAAQLGIPRADTIRDWRFQEGWAGLARDITDVIQDEVKVRVRAERGAFDTKYDQLGQVLESRAVRALSDPSLPPRDLKAIAGTLAVAQKIRDKALGSSGDDAAEKFDASITGMVMRAREAKAERERVRPLGRCLTETGGNQGPGEIEADATAPGPNTTTASDAGPVP
jgi:hypothetical protein